MSQSKNPCCTDASFASRSKSHNSNQKQQSIQRNKSKQNKNRKTRFLQASSRRKYTQTSHNEAQKPTSLTTPPLVLVLLFPLLFFNLPRLYVLCVVFSAFVFLLVAQAVDSSSLSPCRSTSTLSPLALGFCPGCGRSIDTRRPLPASREGRDMACIGSFGLARGPASSGMRIGGGAPFRNVGTRPGGWMRPLGMPPTIPGPPIPLMPWLAIAMLLGILGRVTLGRRNGSDPVPLPVVAPAVPVAPVDEDAPAAVDDALPFSLAPPSPLPSPSDRCCCCCCCCCWVMFFMAARLGMREGCTGLRIPGPELENGSVSRRSMLGITALPRGLNGGMRPGSAISPGRTGRSDGM